MKELVDVAPPGIPLLCCNLSAKKISRSATWKKPSISLMTSTDGATCMTRRCYLPQRRPQPRQHPLVAIMTRKDDNRATCHRLMEACTSFGLRPARKSRSYWRHTAAMLLATTNSRQRPNKVIIRRQRMRRCLVISGTGGRNQIGTVADDVLVALRGKRPIYPAPEPTGDGEHRTRTKRDAGCHPKNGNELLRGKIWSSQKVLRCYSVFVCLFCFVCACTTCLSIAQYRLLPGQTYRKFKPRQIHRPITTLLSCTLDIVKKPSRWLVSKWHVTLWIQNHLRPATDTVLCHHLANSLRHDMITGFRLSTRFNCIYLFT